MPIISPASTSSASYSHLSPQNAREEYSHSAFASCLNAIENSDETLSLRSTNTAANRATTHGLLGTLKNYISSYCVTPFSKDAEMQSVLSHGRELAQEVEELQSDAACCQPLSLKGKLGCLFGGALLFGGAGFASGWYAREGYHENYGNNLAPPAPADTTQFPLSSSMPAYAAQHQRSNDDVTHTKASPYLTRQQEINSLIVKPANVPRKKNTHRASSQQDEIIKFSQKDKSANPYGKCIYPITQNQINENKYINGRLNHLAIDIVAPDMKSLAAKNQKHYQYILESKENARIAVNAAMTGLLTLINSDPNLPQGQEDLLALNLSMFKQWQRGCQSWSPGDDVQPEKSTNDHFFKQLFKSIDTDKGYIKHLFLLLGEMHSWLQRPCEDHGNNCLNFITGQNRETSSIYALTGHPNLLKHGYDKLNIVLTEKFFELCSVDAARVIIRQLAQYLTLAPDLFELKPLNICEPFTATENDADITADFIDLKERVIYRKNFIGQLSTEEWPYMVDKLGDMMSEVPGYSVDGRDEEQIAAFAEHYNNSEAFRRRIDARNADFYASLVMALAGEQLQRDRVGSEDENASPLAIISGLNN